MYKQFDYQQIKPHGWIKEQLRIQADGLYGNLDKIWPDVQKSAWIGGDRDGWERVPYWLDGFIPLGHLLEDQEMIARADRYVYSIIERQQPDGWICPCTEEQRENYDIWAVFLIGKVLTLHYGYSGDEKVLHALYRMMKNLSDLYAAGKVRLFGWGEYRWFEALIPLQLLQQTYKEDWIKPLAKALRKAGADYPSFIETWKRPLNKWTFYTHIVNLAMMLKYEALCCSLLDEPYENKAEQLWQILDQYNGTAVGTFTGDECLSGTANNQGTELCSVVELMYSCELLYQITGDPIWASRLEKLAFNALPATHSDDMWTHQYDQQVNQIACITFPGRSFFRTNREDSHLFGLEPSYGCCTANGGQGWPKLAMNLFLKSSDGIHCPTLLPGKLKTAINGTAVSVTVESGYPFEDHCRFIIETEAEIAFTFSVRIPESASAATVNGQTAAGIYKVNKVWEGKTELEVKLTFLPQLVNRPRNLKAVEYGPLVFSLPIAAEYRRIEYERDGVPRKFPYCDYELIPQSEWRYGFASTGFIPQRLTGDEIPFSSKAPRLGLKTTMARVEWDYADGYDTVSAVTPESDRAIGEPEEWMLYPYGCAKLRMTEMPMTE